MAYSSNTISQQDPAWKNQKLGFSNNKIGPYGCTLTCLTILVNGFGKQETPATMNAKLKALGRGSGFIDDLVVWGGLPVLYPEFSLRKVTLCRKDSQRAPLDEIDAALARGQAVLVELDRSPAAGIQNHWVVLYKKEGNDYLMNDPWTYPVDRGETKLATRYAFGRSLAKIITAVVWYEMEGTAPPPDDGMYVRVLMSAASGLRLRAQPTTASATLTVEAAGAYLRVLDDEVDTAAKIGVTGEWLHVRNLNGVEGYVAAWFVEAAENTTDTEDDSENTPADEPDETNDTPDNTNTDPPADETNDAPADETPPADDSLPGTLTVTVFPSLGRNGLRMRSQPNIGGALIGVLAGGTQLTILDNPLFAAPKVGVYGQWLHVSAPNGRKGYVAAWYVKLNEPLIDIPPADGLIVYVSPLARGGLRMRRGPSTGYRIVKTLKANSALIVLGNEEEAITKIGTTGEWLHVRDETETEGYVAAWYIVR